MWCAEVVLFTAGLEDYAQPILDKLQQRYTCFHARLYRTATSTSRSYPCIKVCIIPKLTADVMTGNCMPAPRLPVLCT